MECSICLETIEADQVLETPCGHHFHEVCLRQWFLQSNYCPLCRQLCHYEQLDEDEGFDEEDFEEGEIEEGEVFEIFHYNVAEMLSIYDIFQAICLNFDREGGRRIQRNQLPIMFQTMMEQLPPNEFDMVNDDVQTVEIIYDYLNGDFDNEPAFRAYTYDSEFDPDIRRMINVYESFARHRQNGYYDAFERFLNGLRADEEYLLFRTRQQRALFDRFN